MCSEAVISGSYTRTVAEPTKLELAEEQLARVQVAALDPADWADIATYGLYALENATVAAAEHLELPWERNHWKKASLAEQLSSTTGSRRSDSSCVI